MTAVALSGNTLYFGGDFRSIGDTERWHLAALDTSTGRLTNWDPSPDSSVYALATAEGRIYAGGTFSRVGDALRHHIAAIDTEIGIASREVHANTRPSRPPRKLRDARVQATL